ncbi:hypothetical protein ACIHQR_17875 [Corallococcus coralloides]|uniref:hypothetical protein n=1 Tax=Corallococcus coralloides TaxID=184914 RepID=UPI00384BFED5
MAPHPKTDADPKKLFTPTPIPEAKAFRWDELLSPTQKALRELIAWLSAACDNIQAQNTNTGTHYTSTQPQKDEHLSTSLLISGDRGTGKTTVLLSAAQALKDWQTFLYGSNQTDDVKPELAPLATLFRNIDKHVIWLDPLDLEPLNADANLLATLLVRVRAALDQHETGGSSRGLSLPSHSSLLEESAEEAWSQLDRLVQDATLMWEAIQSEDDRTRADLQIRSSETFMSFQRNFRKAMEEVSHTLSIPRFGSAGGRQVLLVLPIDNVDRSIEHLYSIVKLTRMVSSQRIWLVLAAGAQEFQLFMERSFQKELIVSGQTGIGASGQEESIAIARRQAATTLRRALPPSYRINLDTVSPERAWLFPYKPGEQKSESQKGPSLQELLAQLKLPHKEGSSRGEHLEYFSDLFDIRERLDPTVAKAYLASLNVDEQGKASNETNQDETKGRENPISTQKGVQDKEAPVFTYAARLALSLPARTLQDFWHALHREWWRQKGDGGEAGDGAVTVATLMLRNAIDESDMPAWASEQLHNRIIRQNNRHKVLLDLIGQPVRRAKRTTLADVVEWPRWQEKKESEQDWRTDLSSSSVLSRQLHVRRFGDSILELHDLESEGRSVPLPPSVAGWFMLLHDVLMLSEEEEPRVLIETTSAQEMSPALVVTLQELWVKNSILEPFVQLEFPWTLPKWETHFDFMLFTVQWQAALFRAKKAFARSGRSELGFAESCFRFVQAAWVDNLCSVAGPERGRWNWEATAFDDDALADKGGFEPNLLLSYEQRVRSHVSNLYQLVRDKDKHYGRRWLGGRWLEDSLPLLVLPEFAPSPLLSRLLAWGSGAKSESGWNELREYWEHHLHHLTRLRELLVRETATSSSAYQQLFKETERAQRLESKKRRWLNQVLWDWFRAVDSNRDERHLEVLQLLAPQELREKMPTNAEQRNQERAEEADPP